MELPKLDDDFAKDVSEFDTLADYKADIKKNLTEKKKEEAKREKEAKAVAKAVLNSCNCFRLKALHKLLMVGTHILDILIN